MADGTQVGAQRLQSSLRGPLILPQASRGGCPMEPSVQVGRQTESPDHLGGWRSQTHSVSRSAGQGGNLCPRGQRGSASAVGGENGGEQLSRFTPLCESPTGPLHPVSAGPWGPRQVPGQRCPLPHHLPQLLLCRHLSGCTLWILALAPQTHGPRAPRDPSELY